MPQVPYTPVQGTLPSDTPMAYHNVRADPSAFGAGVAQALGGLGQELQQLGAYADARAKQQQGYDDLTRYYVFSSQVAQDFDVAKRGAPANGTGFEPSWTKSYAEKENAFRRSLSTEAQQKYAPQLEQLKGQYQRQAYTTQFALQDKDAADGIAKTLDKARLDLDQNPRNLDQWYKTLDAQVDASVLPEAQKRAAKEGLRPLLQAGVYNAEARNNPEFAQTALGVVPKGGYRETAADRQILPQAREVLTSRLAPDKDPSQHIDKMQPRFANSLANLLNDVPQLGIMSGTRTIERQQELWDASDKTGRTVARPGGSQHNHGNAADLTWNGQRLDSAPKEVQDKVKVLAAQYGLKFPMSYEPWHVEDISTRGGGGGAPGGAGGSVEDRIIAIEGTAQNPGSSAFGVGQFTRDTWLGTVKTYAPQLMQGRTEAEVLALRGDPRVAQQMLHFHTEENRKELRSAGYEGTDANLYLMHFLGKGGGLSLLRADPSAPVSSVLGADQIAANPRVLRDKTVGEVRDWAARKMAGAAGAPVGRTFYSNRPPDPRFADMTFDQRVAATNDAVAQNDATALQVAKEALQARQAALNSLLVGIHDGAPGMEQQFAALRSNGTITDIDDINKVDAAFKARNGRAGDLADSLQWLSDPARSNDPTDSDNKKRANTLFGGLTAKEGQQQLQGMNQDYVNSALLPFVQRTGLIPSDAMGTIAGLIRSNDATKFAWAVGVMDQMDRMNHVAFSNTATPDLEKALTFWRARSGYNNKEQMMEQWQALNDPAKAGALDRLREDGRKLAKDIETGDILNHFDTAWFSNPGAPPTDQVAILRDEFTTLFSDFYAVSGDQKIAKDAALTKLGELWGTTEVGGAWKLMKYPPNNPKYYSPVAGGYEWMDKQLRSETAPVLSTFGVAADAPIALVATPETAAEVGRGEKPAYQLVTLDQNGLPVVLPRRFRFDEAAARAEFQPAFDAEQAQQVKEDKILRDPSLPPRLRGPAAAQSRRQYNETLPGAPTVYEPLGNPMGDF